MSLFEGVHPDDLRKYTNSKLAKMYNVSERTINRARDYHGVQRERTSIEFSEQEYRQLSRARLAEKYDVTEHYIRKYAREKGWRKS